jgi:MFS transporter, SHS family, lactate transporter
MDVFEQFKSLTSKQRSTIIACFLGWTLDAFDFFILVFVIQDIAKELGTDIASVTFTLFLTLAMRPLGALLFGVVADRYGRRRTLMANILLYSLVEFACGFAPSLTVLIVLRAVFGIAMGGEWGVGAALTMETITPQARGFVSGLLQAGYPSGYLLVTLVYWVLYPFIGWRGMFMVGVLPALLVFYVRTKVEESPAWLQREHKGQQIFETISQRRTICVAALLALPIIPLWAFASSPFWLAVGAFVMQFLVQGAWGVIPVHLNELSPSDARATFPGFTYQLGNFFAAANATIQAGLAERWGNNYAQAMAIGVAAVAIAVFSVTVFGPEAKGVAFAKRAVMA